MRRKARTAGWELSSVISSKMWSGEVHVGGQTQHCRGGFEHVGPIAIVVRPVRLGHDTIHVGNDAVVVVF